MAKDWIILQYEKLKWSCWGLTSPVQDHTSGLLQNASRTILSFCLTYALIKSSNICHIITLVQLREHFIPGELLLWVKLWAIMPGSLSLASILPRQKKKRTTLPISAWLLQCGRADSLSNHCHGGYKSYSPTFFSTDEKENLPTCFREKLAG